MTVPGSLSWRLARKALFSLDGEKSHDLTMKALAPLRSSGLLSLVCGQRVDDPVSLMGLTFSNRVGMAAGLDKNAARLDSLDTIGFGFLEAGTVTPLPQPGNPRPRLYRLPEHQAILNRMGFNNLGLDQFVRNLENCVSQFPIGQLANATTESSGPRTALGLNIGKNAATPIENAVDDYLIGMRRVYPLADYITINVSSPNTSNLRELQREDSLESLLNALANERETLNKQHGRHVPIVVKIAPDLTTEQVSIITRTLPRHGIDGVIATNTTISRDAIADSPLAGEAGGLSGAPVRALSNEVIAQLRAGLPSGYPIIGVGGILSTNDVIEKFQAGADLVQIYSGLVYEGPALVGRCAAAAHKYFKSAS